MNDSLQSSPTSISLDCRSHVIRYKLQEKSIEAHILGKRRKDATDPWLLCLVVADLQNQQADPNWPGATEDMVVGILADVGVTLKAETIRRYWCKWLPGGQRAKAGYVHASVDGSPVEDPRPYLSSLFQTYGETICLGPRTSEGNGRFGLAFLPVDNQDQQYLEVVDAVSRMAGNDWTKSAKHCTTPSVSAPPQTSHLVIGDLSWSTPKRRYDLRRTNQSAEPSPIPMYALGDDATVTFDVTSLHIYDVRIAQLLIHVDDVTPLPSGKARPVASPSDSELPALRPMAEYCCHLEPTVGSVCVCQAVNNIYVRLSYRELEHLRVILQCSTEALYTLSLELRYSFLHTGSSQRFLLGTVAFRQ